jgi:hypothetical protein
MESPTIEFVSGFEESRQKALTPLQARDHRAHVVAILHDVMVYRAWLRRGKSVRMRVA